jgi:hypothetical protein
MIIRWIVNGFIELALFACILIWIVFACTIVIPLLWNTFGGSYFYINSFVDDFRGNKLKR